MNQGLLGFPMVRVRQPVMSQLTADVTMTTANTYYDGPTVTLIPGTWLLTGKVTVIPTVAGSSTLTSQLWDGTATGHLDSASIVSGGTGFALEFTHVAVVTPTTTTSYKISTTSNANGGAIKAAAVTNGVGNNASTLVAVPIG